MHLQASFAARPSLYDFHSIANMWLIFCPIVIATFLITSHVFRFMPVIKHRYLSLRKEVIPSSIIYVSPLHLLVVQSLQLKEQLFFAA
jgi:hypothetical protein